MNIHLFLSLCKLSVLRVALCEAHALGALLPVNGVLEDSSFSCVSVVLILRCFPHWEDTSLLPVFCMEDSTIWWIWGDISYRLPCREGLLCCCCCCFLVFFGGGGPPFVNWSMTPLFSDFREESFLLLIDKPQNVHLSEKCVTTSFAGREVHRDIANNHDNCHSEECSLLNRTTSIHLFVCVWLLIVCRVARWPILNKEQMGVALLDVSKAFDKVHLNGLPQT